jgi:hypothetical protein
MEVGLIMTNKEVEFIDLTNKQYEGLIKMQAKAYEEVLNVCKENISDPEKLQIINTRILQIDEKVLTELEEMKIYNKIFIETIK